MKIWQKIKKGEIQDSGTIRAESQKLKDSRQKMNADLIELESSLEGLQQDFLAELPGALDAVRATEASISELRNKGAATESVIKELEIKLAEALSKEQARRQSDITGEIALIDAEATEKRMELVETYAQACVLFAEITGRAPSQLSFDFFLNYKLTDELSRCVDKNTSDEMSLQRKRESLMSEADRLRRGTA